MKPEQYSKRVQKAAMSLRVIDGVLFRLLAEQESVCQEILRIMFDMPGLTVRHVSAQSFVKSLRLEVMLDARCILQNGERLNIAVYTSTDFFSVHERAYCPDAERAAVLYITEYDVLNNGRTFSRVRRCMETPGGYVPYGMPDIYFANTAVKDGSERSRLLQMLLRKDALEDEQYPELCRAVKYFKKTKGGCLELCMAVDSLAKDYAEQSRREGWEEGRRAGRAELVFRMLARGRSAEEIRAFVGMTPMEMEEAMKYEEERNGS